MQIKKRIGVSYPGSVESPPLEDVVLLVDSAGVALGVQYAFSAKMRGVCDGGSGLNASRCVEIPLVGSDGEVSAAAAHSTRHRRCNGGCAIFTWQPNTQSHSNDNMSAPASFCSVDRKHKYPTTNEPGGPTSWSVRAKLFAGQAGSSQMRTATIFTSPRSSRADLTRRRSQRVELESQIGVNGISGSEMETAYCRHDG